ncbi:hypothetical protein BMF94_3971 [Rhodotorula taiwanensis]|uniref:Uncharacterized protein n=1 Tax=Rhodotorula taiwanensis TaxID=741276 RepID=A0A2S5B8A3_9BASI|nr:hypothetical protein BMF94_3971 [Rhodotorula taiwanensis]
MSSQSPEDDPTSSQLRDNDHDALVALLDNFIADNTKKRRLKLEGIVSHGEKLAKQYQGDVKKVLDDADAEIDKRIEAFQKEEALRIDETRQLESQLVALLQKRSDSVELAAGAVAQEIASYVEASQQLTKEIEAIADEEMAYWEKQKELLFSPPPPPPPSEHDVGGSVEAGHVPQQQQQQYGGPQGEAKNASPTAAGRFFPDDQFEYADPPAEAAPSRAAPARRPAAAGAADGERGSASKEQQNGGGEGVTFFVETEPTRGGGGGGGEAVPMQVDSRTGA